MSDPNHGSLLQALKNIGVEYVPVTGDAMFKKLFVQSNLSAVGEHRKLLSQVVLHIIGSLDSEEFKWSNLVSQRGLAGRSVQKTQLMPEAANAQAIKVTASREKEKTAEKDKKPATTQTTPKKRSSKLPEDPQMDCPCCVTLDEDEQVMLDIEMQVSKYQEPHIGPRLPWYGDSLAQSSANVSTVHCTFKTFTAALCMWDSDEARTLGTIWGMPRGSFKNIGTISYPDLKWPVCCAQIFLGETVRALEVIKNELKSMQKFVSDPDKKKKVLQKALDKRATDLKTKFKGLFKGFNYDKFKSEIQGVVGEKASGYVEEDFKDSELLEKFKQIEDFEILQLIAASNVMTSAKVAMLCSQKVKNMYENIKISEENIMCDGVLLKEKEWLDSIEQAQKKQATAEAAGRVLGTLDQSKRNKISHRHIDKIIGDVERELPGIKLSRNRVVEQVKEWRSDLIDGPRGGLRVKASPGQKIGQAQEEATP